MYITENNEHYLLAVGAYNSAWTRRRQLPQLQRWTTSFFPKTEQRHNKSFFESDFWWMLSFELVEAVSWTVLQRKQLRNEKKAQCFCVKVMTRVTFLKTFLYCDWFLPWHLTADMQLLYGRMFFVLKLLPGNWNHSGRLPLSFPLKTSWPLHLLYQTSSMCYYLLPSSTNPKP